MSFCHLHVHSDRSLLDGLAKIKDLVKRAVDFGHPAIALTDHGNVTGAIEFYKCCISNKIKPIMGVEFYLTPNNKEYKDNMNRTCFHLVCLAKNNEGWHNIVRMITRSNRPKHFYYVPRIDYRILREHSDGIIALTACMAGIVSRHIVNHEYDIAKEHAKALYDIFGNDLYFEVQDNGLPEQYMLNDHLRKIAKSLGCRTVATCDVHYLNREDSVTHIELKSISTNDRNFVLQSGFGLSSEFYFKKREEIDLRDNEKDCTLHIAEQCNVDIDLEKHRFPVYVGEGSENILRKNLNEGWANRLTIEQKKNPVYKERANRELGDIIKAGFADYFLIVADIVNWAKGQGIYVGPSRGSVAGSLLAYLLRITEVDPIKYNLIFERFYNQGREGSAPDIDIDIELGRRKEVISYIRERFGTGKVAQIATINTMAPRAALKDIMRVNGVDFEVANNITSLIPLKNEDHSAITLKDALEQSDALREYSEDSEFQHCFKYAKDIEGIGKSIGTHAAAVIIADKPFEDGEIPLIRSPDGQDMMCGWDMNTIDNLNILKCDILGLATLEVIHRCIDWIKERHDISIDFSDCQYDDPGTYKLIGDGILDGVFQIESHLGKRWATLLKPNSLNEIADLSALLRPGPMDAGMTNDYLKIKNGEKEPEYIHPLLEDIFSATKGVLIYQESVMEICSRIAGLDLKDSDKIRYCLGKKKHDEMKKWKGVFIDGAVKHSKMRKKDAEEIWKWIDFCSGYLFNVAHAVGYSMTTYHTAYLKTHYPLEFFCSCLVCSKHNQKPLEEIHKFANDAKLFGIRVLPPDIRMKNIDFVIDGDSIRFGLSHIKNLGRGAIEKVTEVNKEFDSFYDYIFSVNINRIAMISLIMSGAMDCFNMSRNKMLNEYMLYKELSIKQRDSVAKMIGIGYKNIMDVVKMLSNDNLLDFWKERNIRPPNVKVRSKLRALTAQYEGMELLSDNQIMNEERDYLGIFTSPRSIPYKSKYKCIDLKKKLKPGVKNISIVAYVVGVRVFNTKKSNEEMAFISIEDDSYMIDGVVVFPKLYNKCASLLLRDRLVKIKGYLDPHKTLICNEISLP